MLCVKIKAWTPGLSLGVPSLALIKILLWALQLGFSPFLLQLPNNNTGKNSEGFSPPTLLPLYLAFSFYQRGNTCFSNSISADENFVQFHSLTSEFYQVMVNSTLLPNKEIIYEPVWEEKNLKIPLKPQDQINIRKKRLWYVSLCKSRYYLANLGKLFNMG